MLLGNKNSMIINEEHKMVLFIYHQEKSPCNEYASIPHFSIVKLGYAG